MYNSNLFFIYEYITYLLNVGNTLGEKSKLFREEQCELHTCTPVLWAASRRLSPVAGADGNLKELRACFKQLCHGSVDGHRPYLV